MPPSPRRKLLNTLPNLVTFAVLLGHVFVSPYTKVEESWTLHAVHDVLAFGPSRELFQHWDHLTFPGAVPRSFLPPLILGIITYPISALLVGLGIIRTKLGVQTLVRCVLAVIHASAFIALQKTVRYRFGAGARAWFMALVLTSFHIPYYAGRTLPNFLALPFVYLAMSLILRATKFTPPELAKKRIRAAVIMLTCVATIIRLELALFLLPLVLTLVVQGRLSVKEALSYGATAGFRVLFLAAPIDYLLWRPALSHPDFPFTSPLQLLWPELTSLTYNIVHGESAKWGTSPWYYYLLNAGPKVGMASLPIAEFGALLWINRKVRERLGINVKGKNGKNGTGDAMGEMLKTFRPACGVLVAGLSLVGHKEWRFIIYMFPTMHIIAALSATKLWNADRRYRSIVHLGLLGLLGCNVAATAGFTFLSAYNYPGGQVWEILEGLPNRNSTLSIHLGNLALQSGSTSFTLLHTSPLPTAWPFPALPPPLEPTWTYSKSEDPALATAQGAEQAGVDYVVTDDWDTFEKGGWHAQGEVLGMHLSPKKLKAGGNGLDWQRKLAIMARPGGPA